MAGAYGGTGEHYSRAIRQRIMAGAYGWTGKQYSRAIWKSITVGAYGRAYGRAIRYGAYG